MITCVLKTSEALANTVHPHTANYCKKHLFSETIARVGDTPYFKEVLQMPEARNENMVGFPSP